MNANDIDDMYIELTNLRITIRHVDDPGKKKRLTQLADLISSSLDLASNQLSVALDLLDEAQEIA